jgi:hypothetical protein
LFTDVGSTLVSIQHHYSEFTRVFSGSRPRDRGGHQPRRAQGPAVAGRRAALERGRWCDVFEIRDFLIQRCFIYLFIHLDPDYAGQDTERYPWLTRA